MKHDLERMIGRGIEINYEIGSHLRRFRYHFDLKGNGHGNWKIFGNGSGAPLTRLDGKEHGIKPKNHIQYGEELYTGRSGNEAVDIFASLFVANPNIGLPVPKMPSMPKMPKYMGQ